MPIADDVRALREMACDLDAHGADERALPTPALLSRAADALELLSSLHDRSPLCLACGHYWQTEPHAKDCRLARVLEGA